MKIRQNKQSKLHPAKVMATAVVFLVFIQSVGAQTRTVAPAVPAETTDQSVASGAILYPQPPNSFDPLTADDKLAQYGFPPRPNVSESVPFARWKRMVTSPNKRLANPTVKPTNVIYGIARNRHEKGHVGNTYTDTSDSWSGYSISPGNGTFKTNNSYVMAEWTVPAVGLENCNYAPYMSAQWIGFDGYGPFSPSYDVLQAGTEVDGCPASYWAWYEWYTADCNVNSPKQPCHSWKSSLIVNPGDLIFAEVWYTTSMPNGHAFLFNYTTGEYFPVGFNQPSSSTSLANYTGSDVEWIVERPRLGVSLTDLTNYVSDQFNWTFASNGASGFYPGSSASPTFNISMICSPWNPSSSCTSITEISIVELDGNDTLWFSAVSPAYQTWVP